MCPEPDVLWTRIYSNAGDFDKNWCSFTLNTFGWIFFPVNSIRGKSSLIKQSNGVQFVC